jgi:glyoxylase-like metal-dependent hydrolase (beta-lactamase superfamily II)
LREVQPYLERLEKDNVKLKYIFETHFHADFVSGHVDLSQKTGAPIVYGPTANPAFEAIIAEDNQIFEIGNIKIKVLHTPGHTMESSTFLLIDENGKDIAIFSGDTLFLGDVGRPDLAQNPQNIKRRRNVNYSQQNKRRELQDSQQTVKAAGIHGMGNGE